ncbi:hypothetical protein EDD63_10121 [Breznakia blatticola]|uniref:LXG domain-containing protein n=1 Tax=Breznakia blatticola TaxID=1754012 RepID=A0A4V6Q8L2_9FIRM|nr:hypothetical protein [Breznakia blatticola]TDW26307.1 hypothetical protein EDD63_10121 [Breznakia blatticola]
MKSFHLREMQNQFSDLNSALREMKETSQSVLKEIDAFCVNQELQGQAFAAHKRYIRSVYYNLYQIHIWLCEELIRSNRSTENLYTCMLGDQYLNEEEIETIIMSINGMLRKLESMPMQFTAGIEELYQYNLRVLRRKIDDLYDYDIQANKYYDHTEIYIQQLKRGIEVVKDVSFDTKKLQFTDVDLSWVEESKDAYLSKYITADGKLTEEGKKYIERILKKDIGDVSREEFENITDIIIRIDESEMPLIMTYGYNVPYDITRIYDTEKSQVKNGYSPSPLFQLVLFMSEHKLREEGILNVNNKDFEWEKYAKRFVKVEAMLEMSIQLDYVLDLRGILGTETLFSYDEIDGKGLLTGVSFANSGNNNAVEFEVKSHGRLGEKEMIIDYVENKRMMDRVDTLLGLMSYGVGFMDQIGVLTVVDGAIALSDIMNVYGIDSKQIEKYKNGKYTSTSRFTDEDVLLNSGLVDEFDLKCITVKNNTQFILSEATGKAVDNYNQKLDAIATYGIDPSKIKKISEIQDMCMSLEGCEYIDDKKGTIYIRLPKVDVADLYNDLEYVNEIEEIVIRVENFMNKKVGE